jgi:ABC-type uncharacterized transport system permease subunit
MLAIAHFIAVTLYVAAAALAATPFARPVAAPLKGVVALLAVGTLIHLGALGTLAVGSGHLFVTGLGASLSMAGFVLAVTLLIVEIVARDASLTIVAAPLAAIPTVLGNLVGFARPTEPGGIQGAWLVSHIALSFVGFALFATSAVAGLMYLFERRELKSHRLDAIFRLFPPLATLDRVNHVAAIAGWFGLSAGVALAITYSIVYREMQAAQLAWGVGAWAAVSALAIGRVARGWQAQRAAIWSSVSFAAVVLLYVALRVAGPVAGKFH